ncbi:MAG TPA: SRPBCC domain-containing protein [Rhizomicrobium sp.]
MSAQSKPSLVINRHIKAAPASVYAAWTDPAKITGWWGTRDSVTFHAATDLRVGGRFAVGFRTPDGEEHNVGGVYREIVPNAKLIFTWAWRTTPERESLVTVTLKPDGGGTLMTLLHELFFDEMARANHEGGWNQTMDRLENFFA